ncbi:hypothetical protein EV175_000967 [Coemansia sp. RSA 1933]|nr:hypothetical protein EV175_000967 [Coemansia sp. RSA 1933]
MADTKGKRVQQAPPTGKGDTETYNKHLQQSRESLQSMLAKFKEYKADYQSLQKTLAKFPEEIEYEAMVPVGPLAFFPGKIVHTNEILVLLGDNWFVDRSAKQAAEIAKRREDYVDSRIELVKKELQGMDKREDVLDDKPKDDITSLIQGGLPERMYNDDGEEIVDIKEELDEGQLPLFSDEPSDRIINKGPRKEADSQDALDAKRKRAIDHLAQKSGSDKNDHDYSGLNAEQRQILELLDQIGSDDDEDEDADDARERDESSDSDGESDEGDAFSDDDRANAARDDDDDDYNDNVVSGNGEYDGDVKLHVVERRSPASSSAASSPLPASPLKGILKPSARVSLFKSRRQASFSAEETEQKQQKSVSFNAVAEAYTQVNTELLEENNIDDDVSKMANLMNMLTARSSTLDTISGGAPRISVIDEVSAEEESNEEVTDAASLKENSTVKDTGASSAASLRFKPNAAALAGIRSKKDASSFSGNKSSASTDRNSTPVKSAVQQNPMKTRVVERSPVIDESVNMLDVVDEELHAREIAQAYNRMRFARMSSGKLDGAANIAERVLGQMPGVTLVDQKEGNDDGDGDDGYDRIELPSDPYPADSSNNRPPEVVHKPGPPDVAAAISTASSDKPNDRDDDSGGPMSKKPQQARPKMSRFKAQRLGLDQ